MPFTDKEKLDEIERELEMRHRVYRWQVSKGKITQEQAKRRIDLLLAIRSDYYTKVRDVPGPLFAGLGT